MMTFLTDIFWENLKITVITINSFFIKIPKLVPEFGLYVFLFLISHEVRLGSLVTFDPNSDPLKMRNEKKKITFFYYFFERNPNLQSEFNFDHFEILTPFGDHTWPPDLWPPWSYTSRIFFVMIYTWNWSLGTVLEIDTTEKCQIWKILP